MCATAVRVRATTTANTGGVGGAGVGVGRPGGVEVGVGIGGVTVSPHPAHPSQKQKQKNNTSCLRPYNDDKDNTKIKNQKNKTKNKQNETGEDSGVARDMSARQGWCPEVGEGEVSPTPSCPSLLLPLHQLVARAGRLVVLYCELRGPVDSHGPEQAAAAQLEEIHQVPEAAVAAERRREKERENVVIPVARPSLLV